MRMIKLKYVAKLVPGATPPVDDPDSWADGPDGYPWVAISDMSAVDRVTSTARRISSRGLEQARLRLAPPDTVLMSMYASLGKVSRLGLEGGTWNQAILGIFPGGLMDPRFLAYMLASLEPHWKASTRETTQANLSLERVANIEVHDHPMEIQKGIADFLDAETARIDRLVALNEQVVRIAHERDAARLDYELEHAGNEHGRVPFRRLIRGMDQGSSPQCEAVPAAAGEWGVLKVSAVRPGTFFPSENKKLPDDVVPDQKNGVGEGDLLVVRANTPELVGSTAVVRTGQQKLLLSDKIFRIRTDGRLDPNFLEIVARGGRIRQLCAALSNGASQSMANIRFEEVKAWPIPLPPVEKQRSIVERVQRDRRISDELAKNVTRISELLNEKKRALITAAVTGQFDVSTASGRGVLD